MFDYKLTPASIPSAGIEYVEHEKNGRTGHLSHALAEYRKGHVISFYSNCSRRRNRGHNGFGWIEYRRSADYGNTWDAPTRLEYTYDAFLNERFTVSIEKAVSLGENNIIAFCTRCTNPNGWEPYLTPYVIRSDDGGETWSKPFEMCSFRGRVYDALVKDGVIYVLHHCNAKDTIEFTSTLPEDCHRLFASYDGGKSFEEIGVIPGENFGRAYGSMVFREDGALVVYIYNIKDEFNLDYHVSYDNGKTWAENGVSFCEKRIRNPQVGVVRGGYILHGRSGSEDDALPWNFVLYKSEDGIHWDEGVYICDAAGAGGRHSYYSNNLVMNMDDGTQEVLIQASVVYTERSTNVRHWRLVIC